MFSRRDRKKNQPEKSDERNASTHLTRRPILYIFSLFVLVLVLVTFVGAPAITSTAGAAAGQIVFGSYRGQPIAYSQGNYFARQVQSINDQVRQSQQADQIDQLARFIWRQAFNRTLFHEAVLYEAEQSGIAVTERRVDREIAQYPAFQEGGEFSPDLYRQASSSEKYEVREFLREQIIQQKYMRDKTQGLQTSSAESDFIGSMASPQRRFRFVSYGTGDFPDSEVRAFAEANQDLFRRINLSRITILESESTAQSIREQITSQQSGFEEMARAHSQDIYADSGGNMEWTYAYELRQSYDDPGKLSSLYELESGEVSQVYESRNGWVIYRVNEPVTPLDLESDDALQTVRDYMTQFERGVIEDYLTNQAEQFREEAQEIGFDQAVQGRTGLEVRETQFFPINYGNLDLFSRVQTSGDSNILQGAATRQDFFIELFGLEVGGISEPLVIGGTTHVFEVSEERESPADQSAFSGNYFQFTVRQFQSQQVQSALLQDRFIEDNFNAAYSRNVRRR
jgi:hypothetical protein